MPQAVDIYALGVLMWEMCNGQSAWRGLTQSEVNAQPPLLCCHSVCLMLWVLECLSQSLVLHRCHRNSANDCESGAYHVPAVHSKKT